jgi:3-hydroxyacyl-CoA dehydrogenase
MRRCEIRLLGSWRCKRKTRFARWDALKRAPTIKIDVGIETIAVIGAGEVGREFACASLVGGYRTILEDVSDARLHRAAEWIAATSKPGVDELRRLVLAHEVERAVREADLIIEAVADEMEMKIEMFTIFDKFAKPGAIFASSSVLVPIGDLAEVTFCPERCVGMRFVARSGRESAVELVRVPATSERTLSECREVVRRMRRELLVVGDSELAASL